MISPCSCLVSVMATLAAVGQGTQPGNRPFEAVQETEREAAQAVCRGIVDALGRPEGMDENAAFKRFLRVDKAGRVWYVCLPEACGDSILADVAKLANLTYLAAGKAKITDAGVAQLAGLKNLEELRLNGAQVTDAVVEHLRKLRKLQRLWLQDTAVTPGAIEQLRQAFVHEAPASANLKILRTQITIFHNATGDEEKP